MGLYTDTIVKREENNRKIEHFADEALMGNRVMPRIESEIDDIETAVLFILEQFGIRVPRQFGINSVQGQLDAMLDPLGMMYEYAESIDEAMAQKPAAILAFREDGKAVAILSSFRGYRWYCPSDSRKGRATGAWREKLQKGCYMFERPLETKNSTILTFTVNVLKRLTGFDFLNPAACVLLVSLFGLALPKINQWIYDVFLKDAEAHMTGFAYAIILFLLVNLVRSALSLFKSLALSRIKIRVSMKVQSAVMAKVLHLPQSFFRMNSSGKLSKRISNCGRLSDMILSFLLDTLMDLAFSGIYLAQMKELAPELFVPAILFLAVKIVISVISALSYAYNESRAIEADMENSGFLYSAFRGIQKIKGMGAQKQIFARWAELYRKILHYDYNQPFFLKNQNVLLTAVSSLATVTLLEITSYGGLTRETYMTFTSSYVLMITVISSLTDIMQNIFQMKILSDNVEPIFKADNEQEEALKYVRNLKGDIRIDDVYFRYPETQKGCLQGVSLHVHPGEKVAIVGESGSGKSTLLRLLIGFEKPDQGTILFDKMPVNSLNLTSLRQNIGSVFQFSRLIPGTIAENVALTASRQVSEAEIWTALDKAAIGDEIRALPLQLETEISETNSGGFSGGQRQQILLARALINGPGILLLDEATSALDNITQGRVLKSLLNYRHTVLMVAHRLSTVRDFDRIILLRDGVIAEEGNYRELIAKNGQFAELVRKQMVKTENRATEGEP